MCIVQEYRIYLYENRIGSTIVSVVATSAVDRGFEDFPVG